MTTGFPSSPTATAVPLVGTRHHTIVDHLHREASKVGEGFRVHLLDGPSGVGKSRIIREVYGALVRDQPSPGYWPPLTENSSNVIATRKVIGPARSEFMWSAGALPEFIWWDIACRTSDDRNPSDAVTEFAPFLQRHALPAAMSVARGQGVAREAIDALAGTWRKLGQDAGSEAGVEIGGRVLELASGLDPTGLGFVVKQLTAAAKWLRARQAAQAQLAADVVLDAARRPIAETQAHLLKAMGAGTLPVVLAIEDLHLMGDDTRTLLSELQAISADVLVLATVWPEGRSRAVYSAWRHTAGAAVTVHEVQPPQPDEAVGLVHAVAPKTSAAEAVRITSKWANPFALLALLSLERVRKRIKLGDGALVFDEDLWDQPTEVERLYQQRLAEVPSDVAEALAVAAGTLPSAEVELYTADFVRGMVGLAGVRAQVIDVPPKSVTARLEEAEREFYWCLDKGAGVSMFREPPLQLAAHRRWVDAPGYKDRATLRRAVMQELECFIDERRDGKLLIPLDDTLAVAACSWLVELKRANT